MPGHERTAAPEISTPDSRRPKWLGPFALLREAACYARELDRDVWEFAVEIDTLLAAGLTRNELRWLCLKGYASHAVETTRPNARHRRTFARRDSAAFSPLTCFVATAAGLDYAEREGLLITCTPCKPGPAERASAAEVPAWNPTSRTLHLGGMLVKEFKVPAGNQEIVLSAFEEEGWPPHIDDPLPPAPGLDAKRRLHHTIQRLNQNQKSRLIHFFGNGNGRAVRWRPIYERKHDGVRSGDRPPSTRAR